MLRSGGGNWVWCSCFLITEFLYVQTSTLYWAITVKLLLLTGNLREKQKIREKGEEEEDEEEEEEEEEEEAEEDTKQESAEREQRNKHKPRIEQ